MRIGVLIRRGALIVICMVVALAIPSAAVAKPTKQDRAGAAKECKALRGSTDESREAFKAQYRNLGACVSERAREEAAERRAAKKSAVRDCREERSADATAFAEKYRNFGKCVSSKSKQALKAADRADREEIAEAKNAAKECASERETLGEDGFADEYGTNHNKRNAFGKCVSGKARDEGSDDASPGDDHGSEGEQPEGS